MKDSGLELSLLVMITRLIHNNKKIVAKKLKLKLKDKNNIKLASDIIDGVDNNSTKILYKMSL